MEQLISYINALFRDIATLPPQLILLATLFVCAFVVLDGVRIFAKKKQKEIGLSPTSTAKTVSVDGSKHLPRKVYVSDMQGLAGSPDAVITENGFFIPVERKPLSHKLRDRYVAQLLVYMRLIEEFEGKKPPYGYLILGPKCRTFKIENSPARQAWLQKMIDEMKLIYDGAPAKADPHPRKCGRCEVREVCTAKYVAPHEQARSEKS
jgi:CRISPR/Cas system-associated exonuclease Cas4 (RecB family)